eukprot:scaffold67251_cov27-Tisochrysis_lutea.AAC.2
MRAMPRLGPSGPHGTHSCLNLKGKGKGTPPVLDKYKDTRARALQSQSRRHRARPSPPPTRGPT